MYSEDQLLPISALQHLIFCERQCALIHVERVWAENRWTVEGRHLHDKAHSASTQNRPGVRIARGLRLHSYSLGLYGQADVVEFEDVGGPNSDAQRRSREPDARSTRLTALSSPHSALSSRPIRVTPIEYKRGKPKKDDSES